MKMENLRQVQSHLIKEMLDMPSRDSNDIPWKVLVMDSFVQRLISPVLRVNDLREHGVTLHLLINDKKRDPIPEVPAIYFCQPSLENIDLIIEDVGKDLYSLLYLNFTTPISRQLLDRLAQGVGTKADRIVKIIDQYVGFECLEDNLFCLPNGEDQGDLFELMNSDDGDRVERYLDHQVMALQTVLVSMGGPAPVLVGVKGNPSETFVERVSVRVKNFLLSSKQDSLGPGLLASNDQLQRPVLMVLDRTVDLAGPLRHPSHYSALINDLFLFKHNRALIDQSDGKKITFNVDQSDPLWQRYASAPFPEAADAVDKALKAYLDEYNKVQSADIRVTVQALPQLTERKRLIDQHLAIGQAILDRIKERELGEYFAMERRVNVKEASKWLNNEQSPGTRQDKLRLYLIGLLQQHTGKNRKEWERECTPYLRTIDVKERAIIASVDAQHSYSLPTSTPVSPTQQQPAASEAFLSGLMGNVKTLVSGLQSQGAGSDRVICKHLDTLLNQLFAGNVNQQLAVLDPKPSGIQITSRSSISTLIVVVLGGVTREEYDALSTMYNNTNNTNQPSIRVIVGSTGDSLMTGEQMLRGLAR